MKEKHPRTENNKVVRTQNVETIIGLLQRYDPATTDLLVKRSGLSYPTVFGIVKDLLEAGIAEQQGYASSTGGRQAHLYSICASCAYTFGIHITSAWINLALTNMKNGVVYEHRILLTKPGENLPECVIEAIDLALRHVGLPVEKLLAVCICVSPTIQTLLHEKEVDLSASVSNHLQIPAEIVLDSTVQGFLDWETLSCSGTQSCLHVVFGDSVQASLYLASGQKLELSGSLSHMTVFPGGAACRCGKQGCLQPYYNGPELLRRYNSARERAELPLLAPTEYETRGLFRYLLSRSLLQDPCAEEALSSAAEALAIALANLMTLTNEFHIVLSGLYSSNDTRNFRKLQDAVIRNLPTNCRDRLDMSMGLTLPVECALGASRMMNSKYACQIGKHLDITKRRAKQ